MHGQFVPVCRLANVFLQEMAQRHQGLVRSCEASIEKRVLYLKQFSRMAGVSRRIAETIFGGVFNDQQPLRCGVAVFVQKSVVSHSPVKSSPESRRQKRGTLFGRLPELF